MLDASGHARIVDFGIAIREGVPDFVRVGTPGWKKYVELVPISWKSASTWGRQAWKRSMRPLLSGWVSSSQSRFRSNQ